MVRHLISFFAIMILLWITGCGTTRQMVHFPDQSKYLEEQDKGRIYVIGRPFFFNIVSHGITVTVIADDRHIGDIAGHRYLCWEREPGTSAIYAHVSKSKSAVNLFVEKGKTYYVLAHVYPYWETPFDFLPGGGDIAVRLEIVDDDQGKKALLESKPPEEK